MKQRIKWLVLAVAIILVGFFFFKETAIYKELVYSRDKALIQVNLPYTEITIGKGVELFRFDEDIWQKGGATYVSEVPQSENKNELSSENTNINIETERYFQRVWINETKADRGRDIYDCVAYVYNNTLLKWVYKFEYPTDIVDIYEQLTTLYGTTKKGTDSEFDSESDSESDTVKKIKHYMYGYTGSREKGNMNNKTSEIPYIELCHWDQEDYSITFRCANISSSNNNNYFEVIYELYPENIQRIMTTMRDSAISQPKETTFLELEAFKYGFSRGKITDTWLLLNANDGTIHEYEGYDIYDYSYAKDNLLILMDRSKTSGYTYYPEYCIVDLQGNVYIDRVIQYSREDGGKQLRLVALRLEGDSEIQEEYVLKLYKNNLWHLEKQENNTDSVVTDNTQKQVIVNGIDLTLYENSENKPLGFFADPYYKNPAHQYQNDVLYYLTMDSTFIPWFSHTSIYKGTIEMDPDLLYLIKEEADKVVIIGPDKKIVELPSSIQIQKDKTCYAEDVPLFMVKNFKGIDKSQVYNIMKPDGTLLLEREVKNIDTIISDYLYSDGGFIYVFGGESVLKIPENALWVGEGLMIFEKNHGYNVVNWNKDPVFQEYKAIKVNLDEFQNVESESQYSLDPIYSDIESPDGRMRLVQNDTGVILTTKDYTVIDMLIKSEQYIDHLIQSSWSPDNTMISFTESGEEASTFFFYDITKNENIPIKNTQGLSKTQVVQYETKDWFYTLCFVDWLNNDKVLFEVKQNDSLEMENAPYKEFGYRSDIFTYSISENKFINLTQSRDGEFYSLHEVNRQTNTVIVDLYLKKSVQDDSGFEFVFDKSIEIVLTPKSVD